MQEGKLYTFQISKNILLTHLNSCKIGHELFIPPGTSMLPRPLWGRQQAGEWKGDRVDCKHIREEKNTTLVSEEAALSVSEHVQIVLSELYAQIAGYEWCRCQAFLLGWKQGKVLLLHLDQLQQHTHTHTQSLALQVFGLVTNILSLFSSRAH